MSAPRISRTFENSVLGATGLRVGRLGVASSYGIPGPAVERAFEHGVNCLYWATFRRGGFGSAIRHLSPHHDRFVLVIQSYSRVAGPGRLEPGTRAPLLAPRSRRVQAVCVDMWPAFTNSIQQWLPAEVGAEFTFVDHLSEIPMCGTDHAHIGVNRGRTA